MQKKYNFKTYLPIDQNFTSNERSTGGNFDINYRTKIGEVGFSHKSAFLLYKIKQTVGVKHNVNE